MFNSKNKIMKKLVSFIIMAVFVAGFVVAQTPAANKEAKPVQKKEVKAEKKEAKPVTKGTAKADTSKTAHHKHLNKTAHKKS
jgi:hypothetical protein